MFIIRKSRKQFHRPGGQSLASDPPVAGKEVGTLRRTVLAPPLPPSEMKGRIIRREDRLSGIWDPTNLFINPGFYRRTVIAPPLPPSEMEGRVFRSTGSYDPTVNVIPPGRFRRIVIAPPLPPSEMEGRMNRQPTIPLVFYVFEQSFSEVYRVADDSLAMYNVYVGEDGNEPDFTSLPADTFTTFPHQYTLTPPVAGTKEYRITVRQVNEHGLESLNQESVTVIVDSSGVVVYDPPSAPTDGKVLVSDGVFLLAFAEYIPANDGNAKADTWAIYTTNTGVDPNPITDTPTLITMPYWVRVQKLRQLLGPFDYGDDVRVLIRVRRSSDSVESTNTTALQEDIPARPGTPDHGDGFAGDKLRFR